MRLHVLYFKKNIYIPYQRMSITVNGLSNRSTELNYIVFIFNEKST